MAQQLSLKGRALRLLATREHSRRELGRKLAPHAADAAQLEAVLEQLQAKGYINDQRVVESVLHRRAGKLGATRVRQELQQKGLDPQAVNDAVTKLQSTELARAQAVWARKFAQPDVESGGPASDAGARAKQMRFLAARGFAGDTIRRVVKGLSDDELHASD